MRLLAISLVVVGCVLILSAVSGAAEIPGLAVYFDFDGESGKTVTDRSGTGNDGELKGGTEWGAGKYGSGMEFDGNDGVVEVPDSDSLQFVEGLTMVAWIKPTLTGDPWQLIGSKGPDEQEFFELLLSPSGFLWMGWLFGGAGRVVPAQSPPLVEADVWQHVAVAWDPKKFWNVYLNGEVLIEYPKQDDELVPGPDPLLIGTELNLKRFYSGVMDEWALFSRGLTQDEIEGLMDGIGNLLAVGQAGKLATTWGDVKSAISD